ncbi:MAG: HlyD family efflux transporter periplasmic adaptor subunit [Acidobacteriota bacterium]
MRITRFIAGVGIALVAMATGCDKSPTVQTCRVEDKAFSREIVAEGFLTAVVSTKVTAPTDIDEGLNLNWIIADGTPVKAGEVIARFDETPWRLALDSAHGDGEKVQLKKDRHHVGREVDERRSELDLGVAQYELEHAEHFQAKDELVFSRNERIESELDAGLARHKQEHALEVRGVQGRISEGEGRLIEIEGQQATQRLGRAEKGLKALTAKSPSAGLAILLRNWRGNPLQPGDIVWPGQALAEIPDLSNMQAEILVLEADAGGLAAGQSARVRLETSSATEVAGKVERVDKVAKPRVRNVPVQYFGATVSLASTDPNTMRPGQRVTARVSVVALPHALVVPRTAVFEDSDKRWVFRRQGASFERVEVQVVANSNGLVALTGVVAGDELALVDPRQRTHGEPAAKEVAR